MKKSPKLQLQVLPSYLAMINGSVGTGMFQRLYVKMGRRQLDVTEAGRVSCAYFVSVVLHRFGLAEGVHATVDGTLRDMEKAGWVKVKRLRLGAVILWEPLDHGGTFNRHMGFYVGGGQAVSNSSKKRVVVSHHWTYGLKGKSPKRQIEAVFWYKQLKSETTALGLSFLANLAAG